jgi:VanZ family protein
MPPPSSARRWPGRRTFAAGLAGSVFFAIYGSLVPFDIVRLPWDEAVRRFAVAMEEPLQIWSRSDLIANVLLMVPVAFCLMAVCRLDRRGLIGSLAASALSIACGYGLANCLEFMQVFTPDRVVSKSDVLAQTIGAMVGVGCWWFAGQPMVDWLRGAARPRQGGLDDHWRRVQALLAVYAAGWFILMALPLELTISPGALVHKFRAGGIILVPFAEHYDSFADGLWDFVGGALSAAPLGVFAWLTAIDRHWRSRQAGALLLGSAFVSAGELVQVFEIHRVADVTDVIYGCIGVVASVWLSARHLRVTTSIPLGARRPSASHASKGSSLPALAQTIAWCAVLVFYHWKPFDSRASERSVADAARAVRACVHRTAAADAVPGEGRTRHAARGPARALGADLGLDGTVGQPARLGGGAHARVWRPGRHRSGSNLPAGPCRRHHGCARRLGWRGGGHGPGPAWTIGPAVIHEPRSL